MKAHATLAALVLLAATQAFAQSATSSGSAGSYDWGQSQVQKLYASPYARPSDAAAATAERKRLTESRTADEEEKPTKTSTHKPAASGRLACLGRGTGMGMGMGAGIGLGMGSSMSGTDCSAGDSSGFSLGRKHSPAH